MLKPSAIKTCLNAPRVVYPARKSGMSPSRESEYEAQGHGKSNGGDPRESQSYADDNARNFTHTTPGETVDRCARGESDSLLLHRLRGLGLLVRLRVLVFHFDEVEVPGLAAHENDRRRRAPWPTPFRSSSRLIMRIWLWQL